MSFKNSCILAALFILLVSPYLFSEPWIETQHYGLGDISFPPGTDPWGLYIEIPQSPYLIFHSTSSFVSWKCLLILDISTGKLRDSMLAEHGYSNNAVMPDPESGWNLFFTSEGRFGKLHINYHGEFEHEEWLSRTFERSANVIPIPDKQKIWYFTNRIFLLNAASMEWSEFDYPREWDPDFSYVYLYPTEDLNSLIAYTKTKTLIGYQAMWFNLETGKAKNITSQPGFFDRIRDIKEWKAMPGYYLIMKTKELWSYDVMTGDITLVMDGFSGNAQNVMQDETGRYLYTLGDGNSIYILDLIERNVERHLLPIREGYSIMFSGQTDTMFDRERGKIITFIMNNDSWYMTLAVIKLDDFSVHYIEGLPDSINLLVVFNQRENRLIASRQPYIFFVDLLGHCEDENVADALTRLSETCLFVKILGSYPCARLPGRTGRSSDPPQPER